MALDEAKCVRIAAMACLPILELGFDAYAAVRSVVVHPDEFVVRDRTYEDEDGVVHTGDDVLSGEAWEQGPVVLAWSEIEESGRGEGFNVVVHEFVHKLDMLGGEADGVPPLHGDMRVPEWVAAFDAAYDDLMRPARARRGAVARPVRRRGSRRVLRRLRRDVLRRAAAFSRGVSGRLRPAQALLQARPRRSRLRPSHMPIVLVTSAPKRKQDHADVPERAAVVPKAEVEAVQAVVEPALDAVQAMDRRHELAERGIDVDPGLERIVELHAAARAAPLGGCASSSTSRSR